MSTFLPLFVFGLIDGAIFAVAALGFTLQFGITTWSTSPTANSSRLEPTGSSLSTRWRPYELLADAHRRRVSGAVLSFVIGRFLYGPFFKRRSQLLFSLVLTFAFR